MPPKHPKSPEYAVLVIDMLNDYFKSGPLADRRAELTRNINRLVAAARAKGNPIVWIRQEFSLDLHDAFLIMRRKNIRVTIAGTEGCAVLSELNREPGDEEIIKKRYSSFYRTSLEALLEWLNVRCVVLAGINTHACIRTAAIDAYQRDLDVVIPEECVSSPDDEHHRVTLDYLGQEIAQVVPLDVFLK